MKKGLLRVGTGQCRTMMIRKQKAVPGLLRVAEDERNGVRQWGCWVYGPIVCEVRCSLYSSSTRENTV